MKKTLAFISYSRRDKTIANWLHKQLENYAYPQNLVRKENRPPDNKYIRPIFIDTKDLNVDTHPFDEDIKEHLKNSRYLILICSINSAKSKYVNKEVNYFLEQHENNYNLIIPFFIDDVTEDSILPTIKGTPVMNRHFPIYNTTLSEHSEANNYCLYQIISFILGLDFSLVYNRYENYTKQKYKRTKRIQYIIIVCSLITILSLACTIYKNKQLINQTEELVKFERNVFPHSLVTGYINNFLSPTIEYLKEQKKDFKIYILMPTTHEAIEKHKRRVSYLNYMLSDKLDIDSLTNVKLPTSMKRGTIITRICSKDEKYNNIYIDFATTTSAFLDVARYKKENITYKDFSLNDIIAEYSKIFIKQTKNELESDSMYIELFTNIDEMVESIRNNN